MPIKEQGDAIMAADDRIGRVLFLNTEHLSLDAVSYLFARVGSMAWGETDPVMEVDLICSVDVDNLDDERAAADNDDPTAKAPDELVRVLRLASEKDCDLIWFAPWLNTVHDLPVFEWPGGCAEDGALPDQVDYNERLLGFEDPTKDPVGRNPKQPLSARRKYLGKLKSVDDKSDE